jgi:D-xylose transport system permease protein
MDETPAGTSTPPESGTNAPSELQEPPLSTEQEEDATAAPGSQVDVAVVAPEVLADSLGEYLRAWGQRIRAGESGALPIILGLVVIIIFFQVKNSHFGSDQNLVNLFQQASIYILLGAAEIFALVLSEIDLSVGYVLGIGGFVIAELIASPVNLPWWVGIIGGLGATAIIGFAQGSLITRLHVPSFVVTLAGLLIWEGVMIELATVDSHAVGGVISVDPGSPINHLVNNNMSPALGWIVLVVLLGIFAAVSLTRAARRRAHGLSAPPLSITLFTIGIAAVGGILLVYVCNNNRSSGALPLKGVPWVIPFIGFVLFIYSVFLGRTRTGRYMYAIGANPEAARRAGINVQRVRRIAFTLSAMTAGIAGLVYASFLSSISTDVPGGNYTLYGVAAAVIGGASLFGGRGKPLHALLGGLVIGVVYNGLALLGISAQGQFIATGIVLLVAAAVDALVRRSGAAGGI